VHQTGFITRECVKGRPGTLLPQIVDMWLQSPVCQDDAVPQASVAVAPDRKDGFGRDVHLRVLHGATGRSCGGLHHVLPLQLDGEVAGRGAWNRASDGSQWGR
jgi:hypothetical protein